MEQVLGNFMVDVSDFVVWIFRSFGLLGWWFEKVRSSAIDDGTPEIFGVLGRG